jgi:hypothetical protein
MSALGQKRTSRLFNQLVCTREYGWWNYEAQRFRGLEIDHQLVLGRPLHWQVGWLLALENTIDIHRRASEVGIFV